MEVIIYSYLDSVADITYKILLLACEGCRELSQGINQALDTRRAFI
jgi:hypothetical protein